MEYTIEQQVTAIEIALYLLKEKLTELKEYENGKEVPLDKVVEMLKESKKSKELEKAYEDKGVPTKLQLSMNEIKDILISIL